MSGNDREQRVDRLRQAAALKHEEARARASRALIAMEARGDPINFRTVAATGGVSKDFLYSQPDLAARIRAARTTPSAHPLTPTIERPSAKSATVQLSVIKASNESLRRELVELRNENARLRGEILKLRELGLGKSK